ncbi:MAG TPA: hypothetical protein VER55_13570 [Ardenticatenaceae bacterium]|nr:hypothetical protein [Ardenticatenaceae bacterium]
MYRKLLFLLLAVALILPGVSAVPVSAAPAAAHPAGTLRVTLKNLLQEHVYLAGAATGAALGGRDDEFQAAAAALDANSVDISKAVGSVYGAEAEQDFLPVWRSHIGFFVDYTQGAAANDQAKKDKAVADLTSYIDASSTFFSNANPNLTKQAVTDLLSHHVMTLATVVDNQATGNFSGAYTGARTAAAHMDMIASGLTAAIVKQFPDRYTPPAAGAAATGMPGMPATGRGGELATHTYALYVVVLGAAITTFTVGILFRRRLA